MRAGEPVPRLTHARDKKANKDNDDKRQKRDRGQWNKRNHLRYARTKTFNGGVEALDHICGLCDAVFNRNNAFDAACEIVQTRDLFTIKRRASHRHNARRHSDRHILIAIKLRQNIADTHGNRRVLGGTILDSDCPSGWRSL